MIVSIFINPIRTLTYIFAIGLRINHSLGVYLFYLIINLHSCHNMKPKFNSSRFIESVLIREFTPEAFYSRMAALTENQQMQVLLRLLSLWRLDEKKIPEHSKKKSTFFDADGNFVNNDEIDSLSCSDNMKRFLRAIGNPLQNEE